MVPNEEINVKAVLFDYDDTIMDVSEARSYAKQVIARELSLTTNLDQEHILRVIKDVETRMESIGQFDRRVWFMKVANILGTNLDNDYINELVRVYWSSWRLKSRLFPDVMSTLSRLRRCGFRLGIVTNTDGEPGLKRDRIRRDGVEGLFDLIVVAGDDTTHVKPHPEPFIRALQILDMSGDEVVYIGDRVSTDVPGAKAAGMYVGIIDRSGAVSFGIYGQGVSSPDFVFHSLPELLQLLGCA
ncbi:HAD family hydrolase [Vulcanisaeta sp. JCM 14467]|uniref:HAD family hydrolase n=1 Tax=Vulcanisaeta sp. JCM 14467 TaxID=1295370 RepID=UPI0006D12FBE|nr:HAD-IA family hydrolase [Vulcanisaeta sp. JCM 14467]